MSAWELAKLIAPYAIPALLAGLVAVLTPAFTAARRLRQELAVDTDARATPRDVAGGTAG